mgnify:CR=1 FL=1
MTVDKHQNEVDAYQITLAIQIITKQPIYVPKSKNYFQFTSKSELKDFQ